jgi:hypothetical protein
MGLSLPVHLYNLLGERNLLAMAMAMACPEMHTMVLAKGQLMMLLQLALVDQLGR